VSFSMRAQFFRSLFLLNSVRIGVRSCPNFPFYSPSINLTQLRAMAFSVYEAGAKNSLDYRMYFRGENGPISPFHDIPMYADKENNIFNMVVEIPRWTNAKMEICTTDALNPIKQDTKKGKLRYVSHFFPYHGYIWNYGAFPQTWEDPTKTDTHTGCLGDNDPIDVLEIGTAVAKQGDVLQVKVLGIMAMIDEGETDWKVVAINVKDPLADQMNDIGDVEKFKPGLLQATHDWLKVYKMPDNKPENEFAFKGEAKDKAFALEIIHETHEYWKKLVHKEVDNSKGLALENVAVNDSPFKISQEEAQSILKKAPSSEDAKPVDAAVHNWHFIDRSKLS